MEIKSINTKYVTKPFFGSLVDIDDFTPHYSCSISTDKGTFRGTGATEYAAEQAAMENAKAELAVEAVTAMERYNAQHGAGSLDIA